MLKLARLCETKKNPKNLLPQVRILISLFAFMRGRKPLSLFFFFFALIGFTGSRMLSLFPLTLPLALPFSPNSVQYSDQIRR